MIPQKLPNIYFCVKYENNKKVKWYKSKKGRTTRKLIGYFRSKNAFKWCKVYDAKSNRELFWFNTNNEGFLDRRTSDKLKTN